MAEDKVRKILKVIFLFLFKFNINCMQPNNYGQQREFSE